MSRLAGCFERLRASGRKALIPYVTAGDPSPTLTVPLAARSRAFTRDQKVALLKALMAVFVSDGKFDESEHSALMDYTAAIGFDREGAPQLLRSFTRGNIT